MSKEDVIGENRNKPITWVNNNGVTNDDEDLLDQPAIFDVVEGEVFEDEEIKELDTVAEAIYDENLIENVDEEIDMDS